MLTANQLRVSYNHHNVFDQLSISLAPGEVLHVQGANGSGKSTLLKTLVGLIEPDDGWVYWQGQCIVKARWEFNKAIAYLGHKPAVKNCLTVAENINKKYIDYMKLNNISNKLVNDLSAGQKQRVALTRVLNSGAKLWVLDEPTNSLDNTSMDCFNEALCAHIKAKGMAIISSHQSISNDKLNIKSLHLSQEGN